MLLVSLDLNYSYAIDIDWRLRSFFALSEFNILGFPCMDVWVLLLPGDVSVFRILSSQLSYIRDVSRLASRIFFSVRRSCRLLLSFTWLRCRSEHASGDCPEWAERDQRHKRFH